jgi:tRNA1(Val) A37 N6-methylase TrmN6
MVPKFSNAPRKLAGAHYTPELLARFVAAKVLEVCEVESPRIVDPAVGDGELLVAILRALDGKGSVHGYDTDPKAVRAARERLQREYPSTPVIVNERDFLALALECRDNCLFAPPQTFDAAIANPPYVRTQVMGAARSQELAKQFSLSGRVDLYFAFIEAIAEVLTPGGICGIIVSNRFMTTRSGAEVRERLLERFDVLRVWDMGDTRLFEAAVLPAVLLLRKKNGRAALPAQFTSIYSTLNEEAECDAADPVEALALSGVVATPGGKFMVRQGKLDHGLTRSGVWKIATIESDIWLAQVRASTYCTFGDIGKIRVGVKTTADRVFVRKDWGSPTDRPELLRPLVTHHVARRYRAGAPDREILYPYERRTGRKAPVEIERYPRSQKYLEMHREALEARTYLIDAGRQWFELWVPQNPSSWALPKLVFPDISEKPTFWMSLEEEIINGDCYWIAAETAEQAELLWLALAVSNSTFSEEFYDHEFHNKLYAGRRRFMTQYVEKFPLPDPRTSIAKKIVSTVKEVFALCPSEEADSLAAELENMIREAFGLGEEVLRERNLELLV